MLPQSGLPFNAFLAIDWHYAPSYIYAMVRELPEIQEILGPGGRLEKTLGDFEFRSSQLEMALLVDRTIRIEKPAAVEAGTGTGKTFGYLIPLILSGKKAVISTGTKNLQEQIFNKDIPVLQRALGFSVNAAIMKGRRNYLCLYRFHQHSRQLALFEKDGKARVSRIERWLEQTEFADRSELHWLSDNDPLWDLVSSSSEQCLGTRCPFTEDCYLSRLRIRAAQASVLIVNHHLFFADLKVKEEGFGEVIPRCQIAVFDEAHEVEDVATTYFGQSVGTAQVTDLANDLEREIRGLRDPDDARLVRRILKLRDASEGLALQFKEMGDRGSLDSETLSFLEKGPAGGVCEALEEVADDPWMRNSDKAGIQSIAARARELEATLKDVVTRRDRAWVNWYERRKRSVTIHCSPLDISNRLADLLYRKFSAVIFTSATLSTGGGFSYISARLGLPEETITGLYPSHFDFKKQSLLYIPRDLPAPDEAGFGNAAARRIEEVIRLSEGRALVLFTSHQNLNIVWGRLEGRLPFTLLKQGTAPRSALLDEFVRDVHSVLFATGSFWQGIDVPGEALSCLIIDKLPFESPSDPLVAARIEALDARGDNPFMGYQVPVAVLALKQGIGRLIRKKTDRGIVAILDNRIITRRYGELFMRSLPPMPLTHDINEIETFFQRIRKLNNGTKTLEHSKEQP
jgi:ATP-dependent DNA helicase DinG